MDKEKLKWLRDNYCKEYIDEYKFGFIMKYNNYWMFIDIMEIEKAPIHYLEKLRYELINSANKIEESKGDG